MRYEYECGNCGRFEVKRSILDESLTECPQCNGKVYQIFGIPFVLWRGRFRFMKGNPEVDMDKIEAEENARALKKIKGKIHEGVKGKNHGKYW